VPLIAYRVSSPTRISQLLLLIWLGSTAWSDGVLANEPSEQDLLAHHGEFLATYEAYFSRCFSRVKASRCLLGVTWE
jgi:hypothetical protein